MSQEDNVSDQPTDLTPQFQEPAAATPGADESKGEQSNPPWGEDFDAEKAWTLVQNLRAENRKRVLSDDDAKKLADYNRLLDASKTDIERAQEARTMAEGRAEKAMQRMARAEVKAALSGLVENPDAIVEDLNLARFIDEDGDVDQDALSALRNKYAAFAGPRAPRPDHSQASGGQGGSSATPAQEFASFLQGQMRPS